MLVYQHLRHPCLDLLVEYASGSNEGGVSNKGRGISKVADLVAVAFSDSIQRADLETVYKVRKCS